MGCHFLLQCVKVKVKSLIRVRLVATPWTAAYQAAPSMGFSRQEYWSGLPLPSPVQSLSCVQLFAIPWTAAYQALPSMGFSRQVYWSGLPLPSPVRVMNQGKFSVIKEVMARLNINILGISELKWTRRGQFNSDDHYIYYCGQESLGRNGVDS